MSDEKGKFGLIDRKGNWVLKARYDEIWAPHDSGYRIILNDSMYGILDSTCNVLYSTEYDYIDLLSDGFVLSKSGRKILREMLFGRLCLMQPSTLNIHRDTMRMAIFNMFLQIMPNTR